MQISFKQLLVRIGSGRNLSSIATFLFGRGIPVFVIHRTLSEPHGTHGLNPEHIRQCLKWLQKNKYQIVSVDDIVTSLNNGERLPTRAVAFTMDDGYLDQAEVAAPVFLDLDCPLTFFVITDLLEANWWPWDAKVTWIIDSSQKPVFALDFDGRSFEVRTSSREEKQTARQCIRDWLKTIDSDKIPEFIHELCGAAEVILPVTPPRPFVGMNWDLAQSLEKQGIDFAPHSRSHNILSQLDDESASHEITHSWEALSRKLAHPQKVFCYPTGRASDYGEREVELLRSNGYDAAFTTVPGFIDQHDSGIDASLRYRLPRLSMPTSLTDFIQYTTWIEYFKERIR